MLSEYQLHDYSLDNSEFHRSEVLSWNELGVGANLCMHTLFLSAGVQSAGLLATFTEQILTRCNCSRRSQETQFTV